MAAAEGWGRAAAAATAAAAEEEQEEENEQEEAQGGEEEVLCAVVARGRAMGVAIFVEAERTVYVDEYPIAPMDARDVVESIKCSWQPSLFLLHPEIMTNQPLLTALTERGMDEEEEQPQRQAEESEANAEKIGGGNNHNHNTMLPYRYLKPSLWEAARAIECLCSSVCVWAFGDTPRGFSGTERQWRYDLMASAVDFQRTQLVRALGGLLAYLQSTISAPRVPHAPALAEPSSSISSSSSSSFNSNSNSINNSNSYFAATTAARDPQHASLICLQAIKPMPSDDYMRLDQSTLRSLQIFQEERHPNQVAGVGRSKEGFSLFALLNRTQTSAGRACLREWMLKPLQQLPGIRQRQDCIQLFSRPELADVRKQFGRLLGRFRSISTLMAHLKKACMTFQHWLHLIQSLDVAIELVDTLENLAERVLEVQQLHRERLERQHSQQHQHEPQQWNEAQQRQGGELDMIRDWLSRCEPDAARACLQPLQGTIDTETTAATREVRILEGIDPRLDELRILFDDLGDILQRVAVNVSTRCPLLQDLGVEYIPQIGYLVVVNENETDLIPETEQFDFVFRQDNKVFFKNPETVKLDEELGDVHAEMSDAQRRILCALEDVMISHEMQLQSTTNAIAELDTVLSLVEVALLNGYRRPELVDDMHTLMIQGGRHPLAEFSVPGDFIPNDTLLSQTKRVAIITGANFSGKSVYLKQVALIVYMAHLGIPVPAERAVVARTDRIFTRIGTLESCANPQSAFMMDVTQMTHMLRFHTARSLLLVDEFGKGTLSVDGIALMAATIRYLLASERQARALIVTHFSEMFATPKKHTRTKITSVQGQDLTREEEGEDEEGAAQEQEEEEDDVNQHGTSAADVIGSHNDAEQNAVAAATIDPSTPGLVLFRMQVHMPKNETAVEGRFARQSSVAVAKAALERYWTAKDELATTEAAEEKHAQSSAVEQVAGGKQESADENGQAPMSPTGVDGDDAAPAPGLMAASDAELPVPLFKLQLGLCDSSEGVACAALAGMPATAVRRATQILATLRDGRELQPDENTLQHACDWDMTAAKRVAQLILELPTRTDGTAEVSVQSMQRIRRALSQM